MRNRVALVVPVLVTAWSLLSAGVSYAAEPSEVAAIVADRGSFVESGASTDPDALDLLVADASRRGFRVMLVALGSSPAGGATTFADAVLDDVGSGTVVVLAPEELGYSSFEFSSEELDAAADSSIDAFGSDPNEGFRQFVGVLTGSSEPEDTSTGSGGGGGGVLVLLLILVVVGGGIGLFVWWRNRREKQEGVEEDLDEARREIQEQLASLANGILELSDQVTMSASAELKEHFRRANETYAAAIEEVERTTSLPELERLSDRLDRGRWELEATKALLEGRALPAEPDPNEGSPACFFDPTHGTGVREAQLETAAGSQKIRVCAACGEKLARGERPVPRAISVGGVQVPAPRAPRSYGGGGLNWLDAFSIILGGGTPVPYRWRRRPRLRGWGGGGWGGFGTPTGGGWGGGSGGWTGGRSGGFGGLSRGRGGMRIGRGRGGRRL